MLVIFRRVVLMAVAVLAMGSLTVGCGGGGESSGPVEAVEAAPVVNPISPEALEPEKPAETPR